MSGPVAGDTQQYIVNVYGFVPEQLTASEISIYPHLAQVMRLHTPVVFYSRIHQYIFYQVKNMS
jgi:hypothetical protein